MATKYDKRQDARIKENSDDIRLVREYLKELHDHFLPEAEERRFKRVRKYVLGPIAKIVAAVLFVLGLWDVLGWYIDRLEIKGMARRYAEVAEKVYYSENNPEVAGDFLDKAIELEGDDPEYRFLRAYMQGMSSTRTLLNLGRPFTKSELDAAHKAYAEALFLQGLNPRRPEPHILRGQILSALKETKRARAAVEEAVALDPKNDFAHIRMAMVQLDEGDVAGADASLDRALGLNPRSKWAWLWKGVIAMDCRNDDADARKCYAKALELDEKFDMAYYNRGWTFAKGAKDYGRAREDMMQALKINPNYKEACYAIGMFYGYEDNYAVAKVWMEKALLIAPDFLAAHKWRGVICGEMGDYSEAIESFDRAILLDPSNADLYVRRAKMYGALNQRDEARRDLKFSLGLDAKGARAYLYLGNLEEDAEKALAFYDRALAIDGSYDEAHAARAQALSRLNRIPEALEAIGKAVKTATYKPERFEKIRERIEAMKSESPSRAGR